MKLHFIRIRPNGIFYWIQDNYWNISWRRNNKTRFGFFYWGPDRDYKGRCFKLTAFGRDFVDIETHKGE